jgi:hypothetical protein
MSCLHRGPYVQRGDIQRGRGIGSTLSSMFKGVIPAMKLMGHKLLESPITQKILKTAKRSAIDAGLNVAKDTLQGKNLKESLKENVATAKKSVTDSLLTALHNAQIPVLGGESVAVGKTKSARKKRNLQLTHVGKKRRKIAHGDIFDKSF